MARSWVSLAALAVGAIALAGALASCGSESSPEVALSPAGARGKQVAQEQGCTSCHTAGGAKSTGPTWKDLAGSEVELESGTRVADDDYLRQAILLSRAEVVKGYPNIMPVYDGEMTDAEVDDVIAYLRDLSTYTAPGSEATTTTEGG